MTSTHGDAYLFDALNESTSTRLSEATIRELLEDRRRRTILRYLETHDEPVEIEMMIEQLMLQESNAYLSDTVAELSEQVATAVWHVHLLLLADYDILRYDWQSGTVRWWRNAGQLTNYLGDLPE